MHVAVPFLLALAVISSSQIVKELDKKNVIEIDGEKDPSLIPEWLAWEHSFILLREWHGKDSGFTHDSARGRVAS